jgi:hypothetical protein
MDYFITLKYSAPHLAILNRCHLFLQVLSLVDIASADGHFLIPDILIGIPHPDQKSTLSLPHQQRPPMQDWTLWASALAHLHTTHKLHQPLGDWTQSPRHQNWFWYMDPVLYNLHYKDLSTQAWRICCPIIRNNRRTRTTRSSITPHYDLNRLVQTPAPAIPVHPATVTECPHTALATAQEGPNFPSTLPTSTAQTAHTFLTDLHNSPFYKFLFTPPPDNIDLQSEYLSQAITPDGTLYIITLGTYTVETHQTQISWIAYNEVAPVWQYHTYTAPPDLANPLHVEYTSVTLVLHILCCTCHRHPPTQGKIILYCATTRLVKTLHQHQYKSIKSALQPESDLPYEIQHQLSILPPSITIRFFYLAPSTNQTIKPTLHQDQFDTLRNLVREAPAHRVETPHLYQNLNPPNNTVQLFFADAPLLRAVPTTIANALHAPALENWEPKHFRNIDWPALYKAFRSYRSSRRLTYTKLTHRLANTNVQNNRFYGTTALCPCCQQHSETFTHALQCPVDSAHCFRDQQQATLWTSIDKIDTPTPIAAAIHHGLTTWTSAGSAATPPTKGSLDPTDILTSAAYYKQSHTLGWEAFLCGRISKLWGRAYDCNKNSTNISLRWTSALIPILLDYTHSIWNHRNSILHGANLY